MGAVMSCCQRKLDDKLMVTKMDLSHCGCLEVPPVVFNAERCIETLILASNQITSLPPELFHCQEMKHLNLNDNCLSIIPPAVGSFQHLVSLKLDKNNLQELPENLKMCKKLKRLSLNSNPWKQMPNIVTQLISLEELYLNDCELNYLPASVGRLSKLKIMELRNNNLCNLPLSMTRLEMLTRLDISDNEFNEFPSCISKLKALTELLLDNNDLEEIIDIRNLVHLEHLDASYNHILNVSETIGCCVNLNMLNLSYNYIEQLPNSIGNISHLQTLHLEMNELTEIPKSIGKLLNLEELNLCNNKLYCLPNTIGLLRNLRNLNVSRNIIEEFPPEIGSCTKLAIINAAYNRLQVLPSEIGYLNNLKVLDLVGNFLMYLPITIINLRGVRAIWLSANQNIPLIPFTEDLNLASGERFLTNIALPQLGEIPLKPSKYSEKGTDINEKTASWNKKIRFAEDENLPPGKLHRTPTPFPKELRAPNRKNRPEEPKPNDNYANVVNGKIKEQEIPLLQSPAICIPEGRSSATFSDGCLTQIREANIRRNTKEVDCETPVPSDKVDGSNDVQNNRTTYCRDPGFHEDTRTMKSPNELEFSPSEKNKNSNPISMTTIHSEQESDCSHLPTVSDDSVSPVQVNEGIKHSGDRIGSRYESEFFECALERPLLYSSAVKNEQGDAYERNNPSKVITEENDYMMDPQTIREMYQNDVIYGSSNVRNPKNSRLTSPSDYYNANVDVSKPEYLCSNSTNFRDNNFVRMASINSNHSEYRKLYTIPPPPPPPPLSSSNENYKKFEQVKASVNDYYKPESHLSKQDFISRAEEMKNRNISPPCYEIAKMYSTKAALFENNKLDQLRNPIIR